MLTKVVFVITSTSKDVFLEQLWVSLYSLRLVMPKGTAHVVVITDRISDETFVDDRAKFKELVDELIVVDLDESMSGMQRSRWLKTKSRELVKGDMIYTDSDTIFIRKLDELDSLECEVGAVKDCHVDRNGTFMSWEWPIQYNYINRAKKLGYDLTKEILTFNGGVVYAKDTQLGHSFFDTWHNEWLKGLEVGVNLDQPSFTKSNIILDHPLKEMSGVWNCQVKYGVNFFESAKILHYFTSTVSKNKRPYLPFWFMNDEVYLKVKTEGKITDEIINALKNPLKMFNPETIIIGGDGVKITNTRLFNRLMYIYTYHKRLFLLIEKLLSMSSKSK